MFFKDNNFRELMLFWVLILLYEHTIDYIGLKWLGIDASSFYVFNSLIAEFVTVVFIAPLVETLLFQFLIIYLFFKFNFKKVKRSVPIIFSSIIFGLGHDYHYFIAFSKIITGLFFMIYFLRVYDRSNFKKAYWYTVFLHALINLSIYITINFIDV